MRRVVVTGLGLISPLGADLRDTWQNLIAGKSGLRKITRFDASQMPCQVAGEVRGKEEVGGFDPDLYVSPKEQRRLDTFMLYGIAAADQALKDANWLPDSDYDKEMTGVIIGSGVGGLPLIENTSVALFEGGPKKVSPFFIPACLINLVPGNISIKYGFQGPNHGISTACSSGAHAIGDAARLIMFGDANVMVAGGAESAVCPVGIAGFSSARALATSYNDQPEKASRPYDKDREGFIMGEGAGVVILEEYEHAKKRGARIYAEIVGYGSTADAHHVTAPHPEGKGGFRAMKRALAQSGLSVTDVGYINAHGTSTPLGDELELKAVERLFGEVDSVCMSSTKSSMGHLLGAAGSVEAILAILAMRDSVVLPTLNLDNCSIETKIDLVPHKAREKKLKAVLSNSFGFGGTNASLLFKSL